MTSKPLRVKAFILTAMLLLASLSAQGCGVDSHSRNRLFAEQDGLMKLDRQWLIHHYDYLGRPAFSAYAEISKADVESLCDRAFNVAQPSYTDGNTGGYTCPPELSSKARYTELAEAHYYDSYNFTSEFKGQWNNYSRPADFPSPRSSAVGLETATAAGRHMLMKVYDDAGRVIREVYGDMSEWPERETMFRYDYKGNIVEQTDGTRTPQKIERRTLNVYRSTGHLRNTTVIQNGDTATIGRRYDDAGRVGHLDLGDRISRSMSYNANGWLTSGVTTSTPSDVSGMVVLSQSASQAQSLPSRGLTIPKTVTIEEKLYYADGTTPRYDGKISARRRDNLMTAYDYDNHGRLASSQTSYMRTGPVLAIPDYSTAYTYDRNANITSLSRQGLVDKVGLRQVYGLHSRYTMTYAGNQLSRMEIEREGEDYEGRTGVGATGTITGFWYDVNGNMGQDMSRGIMETRYNRQNLPTDVYFRNGHRQTIIYDGFGQKRQVAYSQTSDALLGAMMGVPEDSAYTLQGRRSYLGPHVFVNDSLEYSAFPGGYFTPKGTYYYITDWQGNNIAVFSDKGRLEQQATYYPYGEPVIEPAGQRYLFSGKEREHAGGRNSSDFGPRSLTPSGSWSAADRMSESFYPLSPFSFCGGDPINRVDRDGKRIVFINGMHSGDGGKPEYWGGIDNQIMDKFDDYNVVYYDGSIGGLKNLDNNLDKAYRGLYGILTGYRDGSKILDLADDEKIRIVTHSMGAAYAKGLIVGLYCYANEEGVDTSGKIAFELDLAPFQPDEQAADKNVPTFVIQHFCDGIALPIKMPNADCKVTHETVYPTLLSGFSEHRITTFRDDIEKIFEYFKEIKP